MNKVRSSGACALLMMALLYAACGDEGAPPSTSAGNDAARTTDVTWHQHVAPLVGKKCAACHDDGGIAPFSLRRYASAKPHAASMVAAVESGRMPPFLARESAECTPRHPYANDVRLSDAEKSLLRAWAEAGAPEGDPASAAPIEAARSLVLPREDVVMALPSAIHVDPSAHHDLHTCLVVDPKLERDAYITGRQIRPGNPKVLHHVVTYMLRPERAGPARTPVTRAEMLAALRAAKGVGIGERYDCFGGPGLEATGLASESLGGWAPGATPSLSPPESGQPIPRDALVVLDLHYHPTAEPEEDGTTELALMLADKRPQLVARPILLGNFVVPYDDPSGTGALVKQPGEGAAELRIPAGAKGHVEEMTWTWKLPTAPFGIRAYFAAAHMHYVGRDMMVQLENTQPAPGESARECLLQTPAWDFNWQLGYGWQASYEQLPLMHPGDVIRVRCTYDNTLDNPALARALAAEGLSAPVEVRYGEDTLDEMCLATIGIVYPNPLP